MAEEKFAMEQFDKAVLEGNATWWQMELPSGSVIFGETKAKILGYPESMFKHYTDFMNLVHPDDAAKVMQTMRNHLAGKAKVYETTYRIRHKNGEYIQFYDCGQIIKKEGKNIIVTGFVMKVKEGMDIFGQIKDFKNLIIEGNPSIIELVAKIK
jgi:PAS domain S-box-containing protein